MSKLVTLFDTAIASAAKQQKRLKRTIRKHVQQALVDQTLNTSYLTLDDASRILDGKKSIDPQEAIILAKALNLTAREILDAQTDDMLASAGDKSSRAATVKEVPVTAAPAKGAKVSTTKPATRTSPSKPAARRSEVVEKL